MDRKIKNYVDTLFIDVPKSKKSNKIKSDLIKNMMATSKDFLNDGYPYYQAYSKTISSYADVDDLIAEAMISDDDDDSYNNIYPDNYKKRTKQLGFISILLFIASPIIFIFTAFLDSVIVGFFIVPSIAALSCALSIYIGSLKSQSKGTDFAEFIKEEKKLIRIAMAFTTIVITLIYSVIGMFTEIWHPTWIIFFCIPIVQEILHTLTEITTLKGGADDNEK